MKRLLLIIGLFVVVLLAFSLYRLKIVQEMRTKEVVPTIVEYKRIQSKLSLPAKIQYERIIPVYTQEDGKISLLSKNGDLVKKGQILAYIKIDRLTELQRKKELEEINIITEETRELMEKRLKEKEEAKYFFESGVISKKEFEFISDKYKETEREYQKNLSKLNLFKIQYSPHRAEVISPIEGIIYELFVENESLISKNAPVLKIADLSQYRIETKAGEYDVKKCKLAKDVFLKSELEADKVYNAKIKNISLLPDKGGQFTVDIELLDKEEIDLRTSYITEFLGKPTDLVLAVPISCIFKDDKDRDIVYLIKDDKIRIQRVQTGISDEEYIEIKGGLSKENEIVMIFYKELNEGDKVIRLQKWR
ncbi:MAG: efflux RND transporter periplasmic adaptor subunit [bacterium]